MPNVVNARKRFWQGVGISAFAFAVLFGAGVFAFSHAAAALQFENLGPTLGLGSKDLAETVITFIQWVLGALSLIVVIVLLYGGFLWMTARGDANRLDKAKRTIRNGIIGLIIVLISWAIVLFVTDMIKRSTGVGVVTECTPGDTIPCFICDVSKTWVPDGTCALPGPRYYVRWTDPADAATNVPLCAWTQAGFGGLTPPPADVNDLNGGTVNSSNVIIEDSAGNPVAGTFYTNANAFSFDSTADFAPTTTYNVQVTTNVENKYGTNADLKTWSFTTGATTDPDPPTVTSTAPTGADVCLSPPIEAIFSEPMLAATMRTENVTIDTVPAGGHPGLTITSFSITAPNRFIAYPSEPLKKLTTYQVTLDATSLAQNPDPTVGFKDSCGNALDGDADGTAEGSPADNYSWQFTTKDTNDTSCNPEITSVTPSGFYTNAVADEITISGNNFGLGADGAIFSTGILATDQTGSASQCFDGLKPNRPTSAACISSWTDDQVQVKTPAGPLGPPPTGAVDGPIIVQKGVRVSNPSSPFTVSSPHVNWVSPASGGPGAYLTVSGKNFGATAGEVWFRRDDGTEFRGDPLPAACGPNTWTDTQIVIKAPNGFNVNDLVRVQVKDASGRTNGKDRSNLVNFTVTSVVGPGLCKMDPLPNCVNDPTAANPNRQLTGERFGTSRGTSTVNFFNLLTAPLVEKPSTSYPTWNDTSIEANVPTNLTFDNYNVYVKVNGISSNPLAFQVPCGGIPSVVQDYSCAVANGLPSPNPIPSDTPSACRNSAIRVLYSTDMTDADITNSANYELMQCGTKAAFAAFSDANCTTNVALGAPVRTVYGTREGVNIAPSATLDGNTWYRMTVKAGVKSAAGVPMPSDFVWHFVTQDTAGLCALDSVTVAPASTTAGHPSSHNYLALPVATGCQVVTGGGYTWNWNSSIPAIADIDPAVDPAPPLSLTDDDATVRTAGSEGTTVVKADAEGKSGSGTLTIALNYCQRNSDCKSAACLNATCDLAASRCNPSVETVAPPSGQIDSFVTIDGCYFGPAKGANGKVEFEKAGGPTIAATDVCASGGWSDTQIVVAAPPGFNIGDVTKPYVTTDDLRNNRTQSPTPPPNFTYSTQCCANAACSITTAFPASGPPGLCAIAPGLQAIGRSVTLSGKRLPDPGVAQDQVEFGAGATSSRASWSSSSSTAITTNVPTGSASGDSFAKTWNGSAHCYSNPKPLTVACFTPGIGSSDCPAAGNTCCTGSPLSCQADANCLVGAAGDQCRISDNPNCTIGAGTVTDPANFTCVSDTGDTLVKVPPPPEPPLFGGNCRVCCLPGQVGVGALAGLTCTPGQGSCTGTQRGLYCGCTTDSQCGAVATTGCGDTGAKCCDSRPTVVSATGPGSCRNGTIVVILSRRMRLASLTASDPVKPTDTVKLRNDTLGVFVPITAMVVPDSTDPTRDKLTITPKAGLFDGNNTTYRVVLNGDPNNSDGVHPGVLSNDGISLVNGLTYDDPSVAGGPESWTVTYTLDAGSRICRLDHMSVNILWAGGSTTDPSHSYTCAGDTCSDDFEVVLPGNQHHIEVTARDAANQALNSCLYSRAYTENIVSDVVTVTQAPVGAMPLCADGSDPRDTTKYYTSKPTNGIEVVRNAFTGVQPEYGSGVLDIRSTVFLCENPWPNPPNPFPFHDAAYNFDLFYCRDSGDLPRLELPPVLPPVPAPSVAGRDELLREYFFYVLDDASNRTGDAIGIRVMENELGVSPAKWYERYFKRPAPGATQKVDGYEAMTEGTTTYVAGTNLAGGTLYTNLYVLSYNADAKPEVAAIAGQLLSNWFFNTNVALENDRQAIRYDTKRLADLRDLALKLVDYKSGHSSEYPSLQSGSYLKGISTSAWPSWDETLGSAVGMSPPKDVHDNTLVPNASRCRETDGFNQTTCWDETDKVFQCPRPESNVFAYKYEGTGRSSLHANLEYLGPGTWANDGGYATDPCTAPSDCDCFNFHWPSANFEAFVASFSSVAAADTTPPVSVAITAPTGGATVTDTVTVSVDASDNVGGSGMARVEFLLDNVVVASDTTNSYTWDWNTKATPNGSHTLKARGYDRAGNTKDSAAVAVTVNNPPGDVTPPTVNLTVTAAGGSVWNFSATAADASGIKQVDFYVAGILVASDVTAPYATTHDFASYRPGTYAVTAVAFDNNGNSAASQRTVAVGLAADSPPTVTIAGPAGVWSGNVTITATANDDKGVTKVEFFVDNPSGTGTPAFVDSTAPYAWTWNTRSVADGGHDVVAVAVDTAFQRSAPASLRRITENYPDDLTGPVVRLVDPTGRCQVGGGACSRDSDCAGSSCVSPATAISGAYQVYVDASDAETGIIAVEIHIDGTLRATLTSPLAAPPDRYPWTWPTTSYTDGPHQFFARAINGAGRTTSTGTITVRVANDSIPPTVTLTAPTEGATVSGTVTVTATASDNVGVTTVDFWYLAGMSPKKIGTGTLSGGVWSIAWNTTSITNGPYRLVAVAYDAAGNTGTSALVNVTIDNVVADVTPPSTPVVTDAGAYQTSKTTLDSSWTSTDPESGIALSEYSIGTSAGATDVRGWTGVGAAMSVSATGLTLTDGTTYYVNVRTTNGSGLVSAVGSSDGIIVDSIPPTVNITAPTAGATVRGTLPVTANASDNVVVASVRFIQTNCGAAWVDLGTDTSGADGWSVNWDTVASTGGVDGSYCLFAIASDAAGNSTTSANVTVNVQNAAAVSLTITLDKPADGEWVGKFASLFVTVTSTNPMSHVSYYYDPNDGTGEKFIRTSAFAPWGSWWDTTVIDTSKLYTVRAAATDSLGNSATDTSTNIRVDNFPPSSVTITVPTTTITLGDTLIVTGTAVDSGSGITGGAPFYCYANGWYYASDFNPSDGQTCSWRPTVAGVYTLTATAYDAVYNGPTTSNTISVTVL